jgi:TIR domain
LTDKKVVFIAFASEDQRSRDFLTGQSLLTNTPFEWTDMSVKEPYSSEWKERVRARIRRSDGVIALLSKNSLSADGEKWEIECAVDEGKPLLGLFIHQDDNSKPSEMGSATCIRWTWDEIANFIDSL